MKKRNIAVAVSVFALICIISGCKEEPKTEMDILYESRPVSLKQMEELDRGFVAVKKDEGMFLSWRFLGTDNEDIKFNIYKNGEKLNEKAIEDVTNYTDATYDSGDSYTLVPVISDKELTDEAETALVFEGEYLSIPVKQYEEGNYDINDASVGDLDGDGQYEIVVRRDPADVRSPNKTEYPLFEAYELDGTHLWTINLGPNEVNSVDLNFIVYDLNGDGKAEVVMRSFEGTTDGVGNVIGDTNEDGRTNYAWPVVTLVVNKDRSYLYGQPEFLSMYDGETGAEIARTDLLPAMEPLESWYTSSREGNVKRASHFVFCVAYLDGETPSIVHFRGAWSACKVAAWNIVEDDFNLLWTVDCEKKSSLENLYNTGYHSIAVADVDYDGRDEIITGGAAIDDDGKIMYTVKGTKEDGTEVKLGHGDAYDVAVMSPDTHEYFVWACRETANMPVNIGLHSALTGEVIFGQTKGKDTGRSRAADIDPTSRGWEMWGSTATPLQSFDGEVLNDESPYSMNMKMYWDGDLLSELADHNTDSEYTILKWDWENAELDTILTAKGSASNGGTKGQACLIADMLGDWRDELIVRDAENTELRIYTTNIATDYRIPTLMHDVTYREAIAWQNNHYNQPANTSFYFGAETKEVPVPEIYTVNVEGERTVNEVYEKKPDKHAYIEIKK